MKVLLLLVALALGCSGDQPTSAYPEDVEQVVAKSLGIETVGDLIAELEQWDPDAPVLIAVSFNESADIVRVDEWHKTGKVAVYPIIEMVK